LAGCASPVPQTSPDSPPPLPTEQKVAKQLAQPLAAPVFNPGQHPIGIEWDALVDPFIAGYRVYWGTGSKTYTQSTNVPGRLTTNAVVYPLNTGTTYYFAATSYTSNALESVYSGEITYTARPDPPVLHAPVYTVSADGPYDWYVSRDMMNWELFARTDLNQITVPAESEGNLFLKAATPSQQLKLRIARSPQ